MVWKLRISATLTGLVTPGPKGSDNTGSNSEFKDDGSDLDIVAGRLAKADNESDVDNDSDKKYAK